MMHARSIETSVLGNASRRIQHFYREHPRLCATLSQSRPHVNASTGERGENEKSRQRDARAGRSRCRILSLAEGPVTEIRDSAPVLYPPFRSLWLFSFSPLLSNPPLSFPLNLFISLFPNFVSNFFSFTVYFLRII